MKLAITALGSTLNSGIDPRFGRAKFFVVFDLEKDEFTAVDNSVNLNAIQGAGIQTGKNVVDLGVEGVITGHVGPKAFAALRAGGVKAYTGATGTVAEAFEQFRAGRLSLCGVADGKGHRV